MRKPFKWTHQEFQHGRLEGVGITATWTKLGGDERLGWRLVGIVSPAEGLTAGPSTTQQLGWYCFLFLDLNFTYSLSSAHHLMKTYVFLSEMGSRIMINLRRQSNRCSVIAQRLSDIARNRNRSSKLICCRCWAPWGESLSSLVGRHALTEG